MQVSHCHQASLITVYNDDGSIKRYVCNQCKETCEAVDGRPDNSGIQTSSDMR